MQGLHHRHPGRSRRLAQGVAWGPEVTEAEDLSWLTFAQGQGMPLAAACTPDLLGSKSACKTDSAGEASIAWEPSSLAFAGRLIAESIATTVVKLEVRA